MVLYIVDSKFLILLDVILMILLNNKVLDCSNKKKEFILMNCNIAQLYDRIV